VLTIADVVDHGLTVDLAEQTLQASNTEAGLRWVTLSLVDNAGTVRRVDCLTWAEIPATSVTDASMRDLDKLVVHLSCYEVWIDVQR
jgi:hypothetical protein